MGITKMPYCIDTDVHFSSEEAIGRMRKDNPFHYESGFIGTPDRYIEEEMEPLGIESAWIWLNPHGSLFDMDIYEKENRYIFEVFKAYDVFAPFGRFTYFRNDDFEKRRNRLRVFFDEYGFCGIKINIEDAAYTKNEQFRITDDFLGPELDFITRRLDYRELGSKRSCAAMRNA